MKEYQQKDNKIDQFVENYIETQFHLVSVFFQPQEYLNPAEFCPTCHKNPPAPNMPAKGFDLNKGSGKLINFSYQRGCQ